MEVETAALVCLASAPLLAATSRALKRRGNCRTRLIYSGPSSGGYPVPHTVAERGMAFWAIGYHREGRSGGEDRGECAGGGGGVKCAGRWGGS